MARCWPSGAVETDRGMARASCLLIGLGNPLRGDDGVGPWLVQKLEAGAASWLRIKVVDQLLPELAADLAQVERLLLVDAWRAPNGAAPQLRPFDHAPGPIGVPASKRASNDLARPTWAASHRLGPCGLLALAATLYGQAPQADQLLIPAYRFDTVGLAVGPIGFSLGLRRQLPQAQRLLSQWLGQEAMASRRCPTGPHGSHESIRAIQRP
jgi:hydrogenase maturation protease